MLIPELQIELQQVREREGDKAGGTALKHGLSDFVHTECPAEQFGFMCLHRQERMAYVPQACRAEE